MVGNGHDAFNSYDLKGADLKSIVYLGCSVVFFFCVCVGVGGYIGVDSKVESFFHVSVWEDISQKGSKTSVLFFG